MMSDTEIHTWLKNNTKISAASVSHNTFSEVVNGSAIIHGNIEFFSSVTEIPFPIKSVSGKIDLTGSSMTKLANLPSVQRTDFDCSTLNLGTLVGSPSAITYGNFWAEMCGLKNLVGAPRYINGTLLVYENKLESLEGIPKTISQDMYITLYQPMPLMRLFSVDRLQTVYIKHGVPALSQTVKNLDRIINRHLSSGKHGFMPCAAELIKADLREYAKW